MSFDFEQASENHDRIYAFFASLQGEGYKEKILYRYPKAVWKFDDTGSSLPEIKETQAWCCNCGCGEKKPVLVAYPTMLSYGCRVEGDGLDEGEVSVAWQSPCTYRNDETMEHYGMFLWDYELDNEVPGIILEGRW